MNKSKLSFGIIGIAGTAVLLVLTLISIIGHESYSLLNGFITELGKYPASYMGSSQQLTFNIGLVVSGLLVCVFMIGYGILKRSTWFVATSFFGVLTGVLIAAQGVITLNVASFHYVFTFLLFISAALTSVLFIISTLVEDEFKLSSLAELLVAFAAGIVSILFAVFVQIGNMPQILSVPLRGRIAVIPFTIVGWVALLLIFAFVTLLAIRMINEKAEYAPKTTKVRPPKMSGVKPQKKHSLKMPNIGAGKPKDRNVDF